MRIWHARIQTHSFRPTLHAQEQRIRDGAAQQSIHPGRPPTARSAIPRTRIHAMKTRLKHAGYRRRDRLCKQVVAPMFGQIKQARGFRQFLLRGLSQVAGEWRVVRGAQKF